MAGLQIAVQLYSLRYAGDFDAQVGLARDAGFTLAETGEPVGLTPAEMAAILARHGVAAVSCHVDLPDLRRDRAAVMAMAEALGTRTIVMPWLDAPLRPADLAGWRDLAVEMQDHAAALAAEGHRLCWHNHDFELRQADGVLPLDLLLDPGLPHPLPWQADLAWAARAGQDPEALLARYAGRIASVHVKDLAGPDGDPAEGGWADVGRGTLDWVRLLRAAWQAGARCFIVEHDDPRDPAATIRAGRAFLDRHLPALAAA